MPRFFMHQDVPVVSVLDLQYIAYHRVGGLTFDEVFPRNNEVLGLWVSVPEII